jgi:hypothetical protein
MYLEVNLNDFEYNVYEGLIKEFKTEDSYNTFLDKIKDLNLLPIDYCILSIFFFQKDIESNVKINNIGYN